MLSVTSAVPRGSSVLKGFRIKWGVAPIPVSHYRQVGISELPCSIPFYTRPSALETIDCYLMLRSETKAAVFNQGILAPGPSWLTRDNLRTLGTL